MFRLRCLPLAINNRVFKGTRTEIACNNFGHAKLLYGAIIDLTVEKTVDMAIGVAGGYFRMWPAAFVDITEIAGELQEFVVVDIIFPARILVGFQRCSRKGYPDLAVNETALRP